MNTLYKFESNTFNIEILESDNVPPEIILIKDEIINQSTAKIRIGVNENA
jgi:hypothetical protein